MRFEIRHRFRVIPHAVDADAVFHPPPLIREVAAASPAGYGEGHKLKRRLRFVKRRAAIAELDAGTFPV
jgi:hypothetical protein